MAHKIALTHMSRDTNRGDFAILAATHRIISENIPQATITVVSVECGNVGLESLDNTGLTRQLGCKIVGTPAPPLNYFAGKTWAWIARNIWCELLLGFSLVVGPKAFRLMAKDTRAFFETMNDADVAVAKGGSYIHAKGGLRELAYLWRMLYPIRVAKRMGLTTVLLGVSVGEFRSKGSRWLAKAVLKSGVILYLREPRSVKVAQNDLKLDPTRIKLIPDIAFISEPKKAEIIAAGPEVRVGVTVRKHRHPHCEPEAALRNYIQVLGDTFRQMLDVEQNLTVYFIPQVYEDFILASEIATYIERPERAKVLDNGADLDTLLKIYSTLDLLIGSRLHSVILAAVSGVPAIHIIYEPAKSFGTLDLLGMTQYGVRYEDLASDELMFMIAAMRMQSHELQLHIAHRVQRLSAEIRHTVAADWEGWCR